MTEEAYKAIERFMLDCMKDPTHDKHHIYRVLNAALDIAGHESGVDTEVLVAACLLHDIGRERQFDDLENVCHAHIGGEMAYAFLLSQGWPTERAAHVQACISSHRFRRSNRPQSVEAKILFDADKLEAAGAIGIARTLIYGGQVGEPLYIMDYDNTILVDGGGAEITSFFQEYNYKLKNVYDGFYTDRAKAIAAVRRKTAGDFYDRLFQEINENYSILQGSGSHRYPAGR
jgi:uncharacterized protein